LFTAKLKGGFNNNQRAANAEQFLGAMFSSGCVCCFLKEIEKEIEDNELQLTQTFLPFVEYANRDYTYLYAPSLSC